MSIDHWMMFGTFAEQRHFIYPSRKTYTGTIINGNMAAHAPAGLAGFLLEKTQGLQYIIDPLVHAFQHDPSAVLNDKDEVRKSIQRMANAYGSTISDRVGKVPLLPDHLKGDGCLKELVTGCLHFQREQLSTAMKEADAFKYLDETQKSLSPYALISPYFYMTETSLSRWLPYVAEAAKISIEIRQKNEKIFTSIVVSQGVILDPNCISSIVETFKEIKVDGFLLWIDALDEQHAGGAELKGLQSLARQLRCNGQREVINLHGGYFSILAGSGFGASAFSGVTHGPEFGECRSVLPVGGGIPIAKYYIPALHARFRYRDALRLFQKLDCLGNAADFHDRICDCPECIRTINNDPANISLFGDSVVRSVKRKSGIVRMQFSTVEAKLRCLQHYLQRKQREYLAPDQKTPAQLLEELDCSFAEYEPLLGVDGVGHLAIWRNVLSQE